jgi:hypothetical protein
VEGLGGEAEGIRHRRRLYRERGEAMESLFEHRSPKEKVLI